MILLFLLDFKTPLKPFPTTTHLQFVMPFSHCSHENLVCPLIDIPYQQQFHTITIIH